MEDIAVILLKRVEEAIKKAYSESSIIASTYKKVRDGTATYEDANAYSVEVGTILANAYSKINSGDLPNGRMYYNIAHRLITPTMGYNYDLISQLAADVQRIINEQAKIGIKPIVPDLNTDKVNKIVQRVADSENYDDISWILDEPIKTFSQSIVDDTIKANVEFHAKAGMRPVLIRKISGNCCKWCANLAGTYSYPDVPKDVYRRHQRCRCTVSYDPGKGKVQNVWTKDWDAKDVSNLEQNYLPVIRGDKKETFDTRSAGTIKATQLEGYDNVYISDEAKIKPKEFTNIMKNISGALKYYGADNKEQPIIVVVEKEKLSAFGKYSYLDNAMFITPECGNRAKLYDMQENKEVTFAYTEYHECWHFIQAMSYGKKTDEKYMNWLIEKTKENIDKLGITEYNVSKISMYAKRSYAVGRYDEVEAEYYTKKALGGN